MTDASNPAASGGPPPVADPQDPLPDPNWFFRRIFVFALAAALLFLIYIHIGSVGQVALKGSETAIAGLVRLAKQELWLIGILILMYMVAPSAEQITKMIQASRAMREGVSFTKSATATSADGSSASATSSAGPAAFTPPVPEVQPTGTPPSAAPEVDAAPTNRPSL